jgi:hypothetical protein
MSSPNMYVHQHPPLNLDNQTDFGTEEEMGEEKRNQDQDESLMIKKKEKRQKNKINSNLAEIKCSVYF